MPLVTLSADQAVARLAEFGAVVDARSESEFAEDRLPGAVNWPSLNDEQRARVGTLYKQVNPFEAQKIGAALVARNVAAHLEREVLDKPRGWQPLVYCWRGGKRSHSLAFILSQIGFKVTLVEGGYKAFRSVVIQQLPHLATPLDYRVICGPTGSGKTRLLHALAAEGAQVLDLEALAEHRASVLGLVPGRPQPSQKHFETRLWQALGALDPTRPVYVEAESKKVGNVTVPEALIAAMRAGQCVHLELSLNERVSLLMEDYAHFVTDTDFFNRRLQALTALRGKDMVQNWQARVGRGEIESVVRDLLEKHYDPGYSNSTSRNFKRYATALEVAPATRGAEAMRAAAHSLLRLA
jgi:tRNA 2-selenouridine synthase